MPVWFVLVLLGIVVVGFTVWSLLRSSALRERAYVIHRDEMDAAAPETTGPDQAGGTPTQGVATPAYEPSPNHVMRDMTDAEFGKIRQGRCPFCGGSKFYEGPSGGMSTNWYCANDDCGAGFNLTAVPAWDGEPVNFGNQVIRGPKTGTVA